MGADEKTRKNGPQHLDTRNDESRYELADADFKGEVAEVASEGFYASAVGAAVTMQLGEALREQADVRRLIADLGPPDALARRILRAVPMPSPWNGAIGPFYDSAQMAAALGGISRQALAERRQRRTVLALRTADGVFVYPSFQVAHHGMILRGLRAVLKAFDPAIVDAWSVAGWLVAAQQELAGSTPVEWLVERHDVLPVVALAADANRRFAA